MLSEIKLESARNYNDPTRKFWVVVYSVFVQFFTLITLYSSINLGNYLTETEVIKVLVKSTNTVLILCLPALIIILSYYSLVSDPTLNIFMVMAINRTRLFVIKILSLIVIISLITAINLIFSFTIISVLYFNSILFFYFGISLVYLTFVNIFYVESISLMFLLIVRFTNNKTSTLFFPIIVYFIIPFLISSSISFNLLYPGIINFSPTIWFIKSLEHVVFSNIVTKIEIVLVCAIVVIHWISQKLFENVEIS